MFRMASFEERRAYYSEEWDAKDVPGYIIDTLPRREFGFDHDGTGPKDRYNRFNTIEDLAAFLRQRAPFAVYCSVSFYERPEKREGWEKAELVFDIDAKELTLKSCCDIGGVCSKCLNNAKNVAGEVIRLLGEDLSVGPIHLSYSGRGYHIRVLDEDVMPEDTVVRANVFDFLRDRLYTPPKDMMSPPATFSPLTKKIMLTLIGDGDSKVLIRNVPRIGKVTVDKIFSNREDIMADIESSKVKALKDTIGPKNTENFLESVYLAHVNLMDAKVTVDTKRILRLPTSLHSKISMKCVEVKDISNFEPLKDAVPNFAR